MKECSQCQGLIVLMHLTYASLLRVTIRILFMFSRFFVLITLLVSSTALQATNQAAYNAALKDWAYVLKTYVDEQGRTNFTALADNPTELQRVVDFIAKTSPDTHPALFPNEDAVLAYHLNTYNALAMHGVISVGIPKGFTSLFSRARFFKFRDVVIGGEETDLHDYEGEVIRPLNEPRSHFALNCMVKDCPRLPQIPFMADTLDEQLEQAAIEFFNKPKHFYIDDEEKAVFVSEILDFYTEDFVESGKTKDLDTYINQYRKQLIPENYKIKFIDYDWRINAQP